MKPTEILSREHRVIEVVIDCLELMCQRAIQTGKLDGESAEQVVDFVSTFADQCHHGKEEVHFFPLLTERGIPSERGPVGQMLNEHEQGRILVKEMAGSIRGAAEGDAGALDRFVKSAEAYILLLRAHILKEDKVLFPMADGILSSEDQHSVLAAFERTEVEHMGNGTHEKYEKLAQSLADKFGISTAGLFGHSCGCGHCKHEMPTKKGELL